MATVASASFIKRSHPMQSTAEDLMTLDSSHQKLNIGLPAGFKKEEKNSGEIQGKNLHHLVKFVHSKCIVLVGCWRQINPRMNIQKDSVAIRDRLAHQVKTPLMRVQKAGDFGLDVLPVVRRNLFLPSMKKKQRFATA